MRVLMVEDDTGVGELVRDNLTKQSYAVDWVQVGDEALSLLTTFPYDLMILDIMLPGSDGFTVVKALRREGRKVPVLMLTARDSLADRVAGLELGADDYLVKPFHLTELRARVRALLRRAQGSASNRVRVGRCELDLAEQRVWAGEKEMTLAGREYALLEFLMLHAGGYHSRELLLEHAWPGDTHVGPRIVDTYIRYLRCKLGDDTIETVRNLGYSFKG